MHRRHKAYAKCTNTAILTVSCLFLQVSHSDTSARRCGKLFLQSLTCVFFLLLRRQFCILLFLSSLDFNPIWPGPVFSFISRPLTNCTYGCYVMIRQTLLERTFKESLTSGRHQYPPTLSVKQNFKGNY